MKKTVIIFLAVLTAIYLVLTVVDKSDYALQKRLWRVDRNFAELARDAKSVPEQQFSVIAKKYEKLSLEYPNSPRTPAIYLQMGKVFLLKEDYPKARKVFAEAMSKFPNNPGLCALALFETGRTFELEKNDTDAVRTYRKIYESYPLTETGMNMPLYLINFYLKRSQMDQANQFVVEAESFYQKIFKENKDNMAGFVAIRLLATTYLAGERWRDALKTLELTLNQYARSKVMTPQRVQLLVQAINIVAIEKLKEPFLAISIYKSFVEKNPGHPLVGPLTKLISALENPRGATAVAK